MEEILLGEVVGALISTTKKLFGDEKKRSEWRKLIQETGGYIKNFENDNSPFFRDLELVLSEDNLKKISEDTSLNSGYELKDKLYQSFMKVMNDYEIPREIAESYISRIISILLENLERIDPDKYKEVYFQDWRMEERERSSELSNKLDRLNEEVSKFNSGKIRIKLAGELDVELRRSTNNPSIGISFFKIDDEEFQKEFNLRRLDEIIYIRGISKEETIYCIINELWRIKDGRTIYIVRDIESWNKIITNQGQNNIYIPWFYADEILAIPNNTTIFVSNEDHPSHQKNTLCLRPRTRETLSECLQEAGMSYEKIYGFLLDTHGLYNQMKKQMFKGKCLRTPVWVEKLSEQAKKTCLLIGSWDEIEGDQLIIETLYGDTYSKFLEEISSFVKGEDSFLYKVKLHGKTSYYLSSVQNVWTYLNVDVDEQIWKSFIGVAYDIINESEKMMSYQNDEKIIAQLKGERLFWSETIRKGILKTLLVKSTLQNDIEAKKNIEKLISKILDNINTEEQWKYISQLWPYLCEISPQKILDKLAESVNDENSELLKLFRLKQNGLFTKHFYINYLLGLESFFSQKDYFWSAYRILLKLDSYNFQYNSVSTEDIIEKILYSRRNYSVLQSPEDKIKGAEVAFNLNNPNIWKYLATEIDDSAIRYVSPLEYPKFRLHETMTVVKKEDLLKTQIGYFNLLIENMDSSLEHCLRMIEISTTKTDEIRNSIITNVLNSLEHMTSEEVMILKNKLREIIFEHRYYSSSWRVDEEILEEYEELLNKISIEIPEYDYSYLFVGGRNVPLLKPAAVEEENSYELNEQKKQELMIEMVQEFNKNGYDILRLAQVCARQSNSTLGKFLAKYWNQGKWDFSVFKRLLKSQQSGVMAIDYLNNLQSYDKVCFDCIIDFLLKERYSEEVIAKVYVVETSVTTTVPLVSKASESIKKEYWKNCIYLNSINKEWAIKECKKYSTISVYLDLLYRIHRENPLSPDLIFEYMTDIEYMPFEDERTMVSYYLKKFIIILQDAFYDDREKSVRIRNIEFYFMKLLGWESMRCFQREIKNDPDLFGYIIAKSFKRDNDADEQLENIDEWREIYKSVHFCPAEQNGYVNQEKLERWIKKYILILQKNGQEKLLSKTLGRIFAFSPTGEDGHYPRESIREMIEKYGDNELSRAFQQEVYYSRNFYTPSAGKKELKISEGYVENAQYLDKEYPKTARIFYGLSEWYKMDASMQRIEAETDFKE